MTLTLNKSKFLTAFIKCSKNIVVLFSAKKILESFDIERIRQIYSYKSELLEMNYWNLFY